MTVRWGILGTGLVARKFTLGLRQLPGAVVTRVASGRNNNAQAFARDFGLAGIADTAEELATSPDVDVVYIATPPSLHRSHAVSCMEAGKSVLVEKPFAATFDDARAIVEAARKHDRFCMEGMWTRFLPLIRTLKLKLAAGEIGDLRTFSGSFSAPNAPDPAQSLWRPKMGGGALLHRGIYPLSLACHLLGPVVEQQGLMTFGETGVDEETLLVLRHDNGTISTCAASLRSTAPNHFVLTGTEGMIQVEAPIYRPFRMRITRVPIQRAKTRPSNTRMEALKEGAWMQRVNQRLSRLSHLIRGRRSTTLMCAFRGNGYHYEAAEVMHRMAAGETESPIMSLDESLQIMKIMDDSLAQGGERSQRTIT